MGRMTSEALKMMDDLNLQRQLEMHLVGNFYPRHDKRLASICIEAINTYNENLYEYEYGDFSSLDKMIDLPKNDDGEYITTFRNSNQISVRDTIEVLRLDTWLDILEEEE